MSGTPSNSLRSSLPPGPAYREGSDVTERGRGLFGGSELTTLLLVGAAGAGLALLAWNYLGPDLVRYMKIRNM